MSSKDKQKKCGNFEPQLFRRNLCKNCFKTEAQHNADDDAATDSDAPVPESPSASLPVSPTTPEPPAPTAPEPVKKDKKDKEKKKEEKKEEKEKKKEEKEKEKKKEEKEKKKEEKEKKKEEKEKSKEEKEKSKKEKEKKKEEKKKKKDKGKSEEASLKGSADSLHTTNGSSTSINQSDSSESSASTTVYEDAPEAQSPTATRKTDDVIKPEDNKTTASNTNSQFSPSPPGGAEVSTEPSDVTANTLTNSQNSSQNSQKLEEAKENDQSRCEELHQTQSSRNELSGDNGGSSSAAAEREQRTTSPATAQNTPPESSAAAAAAAVDTAVSSASSDGGIHTELYTSHAGTKIPDSRSSHIEGPHSAIDSSQQEVGEQNKHFSDDDDASRREESWRGERSAVGAEDSSSEDRAVPLTSGGRYYAGRDESVTDDEHRLNNIYNISAPLIGTRVLNDDEEEESEPGSTLPYAAAAEPVKRARGLRQIRRRSRSRDDTDFESTNRRLGSYAMDLDRSDAMMEGTRLLIDSLRDKVSAGEQEREQLERERTSLQELLALRKTEYYDMKESLKGRVNELEDAISQLHAEKQRLHDTLKMPESERANLQAMEKEISKLRKKLESAEACYNEALDDNESLRHEVRDLHLEMDEMHDQFREEEALEFRELQKELEATAKNCRILQFKLRKSERRNEQMEGERMQYEDKLRQLENRLEASDDKQHIRELEEELKMAKEVSVRLHDELELVEEKRARYEEELDRVNDILTESESRRRALQKEVDTLSEEMEHLEKSVKIKKSSVKDTLDVPDARAPKLGQKGKDSSVEYDLAQLMRDLSDSLERENDLKEQYKFMEEENGTMQKKLSDLEEENEILTIRLEKFSTAKSPKFFKKKSDVESEAVSEREHELKLQMELAEQELKVLRRKMDEVEEENATLHKQVLQHQAISASKSASRELLSEDRPYDEQLQEMAGDIDKLKQKLIEKDQQARRSKLQKSKSLEEPGPVPPPTKESLTPDARKQLEETLAALGDEREKLLKENASLRLAQQVPSVQTDDAALQNIDLQARVHKLEADNSALRESNKKLDLQSTRLRKETDRLKAKLDASQDAKDAQTYKDKLKAAEKEKTSLQKKANTLAMQNDKLGAQLEKTKKKDNKDAANELAKLPKDDLLDRIWDLEQEIKSLQRVIQNREEENARLEASMEQCHADMDHMFAGIREREKELMDEVEGLEQRYAVTANLLEIVTERAEAAQAELERHAKESVRSSVSALSGASVGEDEVFLSKSAEQRGEQALTQDWETQFKKRIESLEALLAEEREKVQSVAKKYEKADGLKAKFEEEGNMFKKERDIAKQELALCQKQLAGAEEQITDLKERLKQVQEAHKITKQDKDKMMDEVEREKQKIREESEKEEKTKKASMASWRWEKQELERQVKELKKSEEHLHAELTRQQFKWKAAGEDIEKEQNLKLKMQEEITTMKKQITDTEEQKSQLEKKIQELESSHKKNEETWQRERSMLESDKAAAVKEAKLKETTIKSKNDIIQRKDDVLKEKDAALKERDDQLAEKLSELKKESKELKGANKKLTTMEGDVTRLEASVKELQSSIKDKETAIRNLNDNVSKRDDRLKEKDDILQQINRKLTEKENQVSDMDNTIRSTMQKLKDRDTEITKLQRETMDAISKQKKLAEDAQKKLDKLQKDSTKENTQLNKDKTKLQSDLDSKTKEHGVLLKELEKVREEFKRKEDRFKKDKDKLEIELKQLKEKLHSSTLSRTMSPGDVVKTLSTEKETLISEKHKMADEMNQVRKELRDAKKSWDKERDDMQKMIQEKSKLVDDTNSICDKLQKDVKKLKEQSQNGAAPTSKLTPIPVMHEAASSKRDAGKDAGSTADLAKRLEQQEIIFSAEKQGLTDLYEGKMAHLKETVSAQEEQMKKVREENDKHLTLLEGSRVALQDLRSRYDTGLTTWNEEKEHLKRKAELADDRAGKITRLEKEISDLRAQLNAKDAKRQEAENKLAAEKVTWKAEKAAMATKMKKGDSPSDDVGDEPTSPTSVGPVSGRPRINSSVSDFRSRFEKFGAPAKKAVSPPPASAAASGNSALSDCKTVDKKAWEESQQIVKDLQKQMSELQKQRDADQKDYQKQLQSQKLDWEKEKRELKERNMKLSKQSDSLSSVEKSLVDLQYKMAAEKESWAIERTQCNKSLEDTKRQQQQEREKMNELIAEVKKLRALAPLLEAEKQSSSATIIKVKGTSVEREDPKKALDKPVVQILTQALAHISRLLEGLNNPLIRTKPRSNAPPSFRRSQSMSEVEIVPSHTPESFAVPHVLSMSRPAPQLSSVMHVTPVSHAPPPPRPTVIMRRAISTQDSPHNYESATVDRKTYKSGSRGGGQRGSFYQSGTQSAYGSRDTTPERTLGLTKRSPYPVAPPSMIISPSMTPRRAPSVERDAEKAALTEKDMQKLYAKLGEIDHQEESKAIVEERGKGIRVLMKSVSVDTDEVLDCLPSAQSPATAPVQQQHKKTQPTYNVIAKMHGGLFEDAPLSQTLPASIRIGELVITPGIMALTRIERKVRQKRSDSVSPRTARREFYQNYPRDSSVTSVNRRPLGPKRQDSESDWDESPAPGKTRYDSDISFSTPRYRYGDDSDTEGPAAAAAPLRSRYESDTEDMDVRATSRFSASKFLKNVKSKRRMFGSARSVSVESSPVGSSAMMAGVQALSPAAPSGFQLPPDDEAEEKEKKKHKKKKDKKSKDGKEDKEEKAEKKERKSREEKEEKRRRKEEKEREKSRTREEKKEKKEKKKRSASVDVIARFRLGGDKKDGSLSQSVVEVQKECRQAPICQAEVAEEEPQEGEEEGIPHFATLRRRPKGTKHVTICVEDGDTTPSVATTVATSPMDKSLKSRTPAEEKQQHEVKGSRAPPLTHLFSKPPTPKRKPPTRWLSAKKAFEERPIVLKVMERKDFSLLAHFTETPV